MEKSEKCPVYAQGRAGKIFLPQADGVICSLEEGECPYNNGQTLHWEGDPITICNTGGLIKKVLLVN